MYPLTERCHGFFLELPKNTANPMETSATATISISSIIVDPFPLNQIRVRKVVNNGPYR
jgi:hypothetical protein